MEIKLWHTVLIPKEVLLLSFILLRGWSLQLSDHHLCSRKHWWEVHSNSIDLNISRNACYPPIIEIYPEGEKLYTLDNVKISKNLENFPALPNHLSKISSVRRDRTSYALNERNFGYDRDVRRSKERIPSSGDRNRVSREAFTSRSPEERQSNLRRMIDLPFRNVERSERSDRSSLLRRRFDLNRDDNNRLLGRRSEVRHIKNDLENHGERMNRRSSTRRISLYISQNLSRKPADSSRDEKYRTDNGPSSRSTQRSERVKDTFRERKNNPIIRNNERRIEYIDRIRFDFTTSFDFNRVSKHVPKLQTFRRTGDEPHLRRNERSNEPATRIREDRRQLYDRITSRRDNRKDGREVRLVSRTDDGERRLNKRETTTSRKITERRESKVRISPVSIRIRTDFLQRISTYFKNLNSFVPTGNHTVADHLEISTTDQQLSQVNFASSKSIVDMLRKKRKSCSFSELIVGVAGVVATFCFRPKTVHSFV